MSDELLDDNEEMPDDGDSSSQEQTESDGKSAISSDLIRGHINTIILRTLYERDKYGYEIINEIEQKSHGQYTLKQPTLYSALKRLESQGYIKAYWKTDEVTLGGRRKYFKLTDSGREITEKNQAEWEYSRTVIDNLISDRSFDFTQPPPAPLDFNILRNSVSRVPTTRLEVVQEGNQTVDQQQQTAQQAVQQPTEQAQQPPEQIQNPAQQPQPVSDQYLVRDVNTTTPAPAEQVAEQNTQAQVAQTQPQQPNSSSEQQAVDEQRRLNHENYLRLISTPATQPDNVQRENVSPYSDEVDTNKLIYNNKPETERDYKNLISGIFNKAIRNNDQPRYTVNQVEQQQQTQQVQQVSYVSQPTVQPYVASEKAKLDGLKINTSHANQPTNTRVIARKATHNVGKNLLVSSAIVAVLLLLEFVLCLVFKDKLNCQLSYPLVILALAITQFAIFAIVALSSFGKNLSKPASNNYISVSIIITIIAILIICVVGFLLNVNFSSVSDIMKKLVIPCLTALAIPIFTLSFYILNK